jgi:hypothetical protein
LTVTLSGDGTRTAKKNQKRGFEAQGSGGVCASDILQRYRMELPYGFLKMMLCPITTQYVAVQQTMTDPYQANP